MAYYLEICNILLLSSDSEWGLYNKAISKLQENLTIVSISRLCFYNIYPNYPIATISFGWNCHYKTPLIPIEVMFEVFIIFAFQLFNSILKDLISILMLKYTSLIPCWTKIYISFISIFIHWISIQIKFWSLRTLLVELCQLIGYGFFKSLFNSLLDTTNSSHPQVPPPKVYVVKWPETLKKLPKSCPKITKKWFWLLIIY